MAFPPAAVIVDGTTVSNKAFWDAYNAETESALVDAGNPTRTPAQTTSEVVAARDGSATLLAKLQDMESLFSGVGPSAVRNGFVLSNLLANDTFAMWSRGDASAPDHWALSAGAAIARCGDGLADTQQISGFGKNLDRSFAARLTYGAAAAVLSQAVIPDSSTAADWLNAFIVRKKPVDASGATISGYGDDDAYLKAYLLAHAYSDGTNRVRCAIYDGGLYTYSPYHPGDSAWHSLIAGPADLSSLLALQAQLRVEAAGAGYFQGSTLMLAPLGLPPMYVPGKVRYKTLTYYANNPATGVLQYFTFARPVHILGAQMQCLTAGTVTAPTIDLLTPIGGAYSSLFVTAPTIATGQLVGAAQACDPAAANHRRRTIRPALSASATQLDNTSLRLDYVDDGGNTLRDLMVTIHYFEYDRPLDLMRSISDLGE